MSSSSPWRKLSRLLTRDPWGGNQPKLAPPEPDEDESNQADETAPSDPRVAESLSRTTPYHALLGAHRGVDPLAPPARTDPRTWQNPPASRPPLRLARLTAPTPPPVPLPESLTRSVTDDTPLFVHTAPVAPPPPLVEPEHLELLCGRKKEGRDVPAEPRLTEDVSPYPVTDGDTISKNALAPAIAVSAPEPTPEIPRELAPPPPVEASASPTADAAAPDAKAVTAPVAPHVAAPAPLATPGVAAAPAPVAPPVAAAALTPVAMPAPTAAPATPPPAPRPPPAGVAATAFLRSVPWN